ncbi:MAG: hypothetical protein KC621_09605 [Myxococcales bacterium]|nr:hypothetical protein [Myxococcales bacterium]
MLWSLLLACESPNDGPPVGAEETGLERDGCWVPAALARPTTIEETFDLIDALPGGPEIDVPCLLEALERPLYVELTMDTLSAQPAASPRSPRIFLRNAGLTLSVVPEGAGRPLLEFAEHQPSGLSIKAELHFPIEQPLDRRVAFERVLSDQVTIGTLCGLCHWDETQVEEGVYASIPLRPTATTLVALEELEDEWRSCERAVEPDRCAMLDALFDHGPVVHAPFPSDYPTIYDQ